MAKEAFDCLFELDPYRIGGTDTYSNVLYVLGENTELALLAQRTALHSPNASETHCIQGNLYSSEGRHAAAVGAFKRALVAKRDCESAWTLMGHEHVELRQTDEAVKCYRHAVDINPRDYRAWYGLAQAYEMLGLPQYASFYYHKAASLRPGDPRMWCALGMVYQSAGQDGTAATCYRRAHECNDREGLATIRLAQLAREEEDYEQAEKYYSEHVRQRDELGVRICFDTGITLIRLTNKDSIYRMMSPQKLQRRFYSYVKHIQSDES
jgi:anaphase-promoting complex subunit 8